MTSDDAAVAFAELSREQQLLFLARFGHELTVEARGTYVVGTVEVADAPALREKNEAQHRVFGLIRDLLLNEGSRLRMPEAGRMLFEQSSGAFQRIYAKVRA